MSGGWWDGFAVAGQFWFGLVGALCGGARLVPQAPAGQTADNTVKGQGGGGRQRHNTDFTAPVTVRAGTTAVRTSTVGSTETGRRDERARRGLRRRREHQQQEHS